MSENTITFEEIKALTTDNNVLIIDVREPNELAGDKKVPNSINIPLGHVESALKNLSEEEFKEKYQQTKPDHDSPLVFTCQLGGRALKGLHLAESLGFKNLKYYKGSWAEWEQKIK